MSTSMEYLTGLSVADLSGPIITFDQLGGGGTVLNKALAIPVHLGGPWNSVEYVVIPPVVNGTGSSVGAHVQDTDEIYFVHRGTGVLTTNGEPCPVGPGFLALAPRGTRHGIRNESTSESLAILVIELKVSDDGAVHRPTSFPSLPALLHDADGLRMARVDLASRFSAPWGTLALVEIPAGGCIEEYRDVEHDENVFLVSGTAAVVVGGERFVSDERGLNVLVPRGVRRRIANESTSAALMILSVQARNEGPRVAS